MLFVFAIDHGARVRRLQRLTLLLQLPQAPNGMLSSRLGHGSTHFAQST
jgi:hypothetical protein